MEHLFNVSYETKTFEYFKDLLRFKDLSEATRKDLNACMLIILQNRDKGTTYYKTHYKKFRLIRMTQKKKKKEKISKYGAHVRRDCLVQVKHIFGKGKSKKEK